METITWILGSLLLSILSALTGKYIGGKGKVESCDCIARRKSCTTINNMKVDYLEKQFHELKEELKHKIDL